MLRAKTQKSSISRCPLINCSYRNFRLDNLKNHLKSRRHKITNVEVINKIFGIVRSNSLPADHLLRVQNDDVVQVSVHLPRQESTSSVPFVQSQNAVANTPRSTFQNLNTGQEVSETSEQDRREGELTQSPLTTVSSNEQMRNLTEAVASLNVAIQKININERDMKTVLQQTKAVLENKLSDMEQRSEKADNIMTNVNYTSQSLIQLQMKHPWLQVKLREPPSPPSGACSLCQRHFMQIRRHRGYSRMQNWVDCSVVQDSDHRAQKIISHEQSECHTICVSAEDQRKRNAIQSSFLINQKTKSSNDSY